MINPNSQTPIYIQIAEWIETEILSGRFESDGKVFSQYQLADMFNINPATAAKGLNLLAEEDILYKKRGLGMFVTSQAHGLIIRKRKNETLRQLVEDLVAEAERLQVSKHELAAMIQTEMKKQGGS